MVTAPDELIESTQTVLFNGPAVSAFSSNGRSGGFVSGVSSTDTRNCACHVPAASNDLQPNSTINCLSQSYTEVSSVVNLSSNNHDNYPAPVLYVPVGTANSDTSAALNIQT